MFQLTSLPTDLIRYIYGTLNEKARRTMRKTCKTLHSMPKPNVTESPAFVRVNGVAHMASLLIEKALFDLSTYRGSLLQIRSELRRVRNRYQIPSTKLQCRLKLVEGFLDHLVSIKS